MAHVHDPVIRERLIREASDIHPGRFFGHLIRDSFLWVFTALGFLLGGIWFVVIFAVVAVKYGFRVGAKIPVPEPRKPSLPQ